MWIDFLSKEVAAWNDIFKSQSSTNTAGGQTDMVLTSIGNLLPPKPERKIE